MTRKIPIISLEDFEAKAKKQSTENIDERSKLQCAMRSCKTGPDPESHEYFSKVKKLRCDKVCQCEAMNGRRQR